jgi:serine/threonine protein kinase
MGMSFKLDGPNPRILGGTLLYYAPEILKDGSFEQKSDVWSLGLVAYQIFHPA